MTASELTGATRRAGTTVGSGTETTGARRVYAYARLGNRDTYTKGTRAQTTHQNPLRQQAVTRRPPGPLPAAGSRQRRAIVETASSPVTGQNLLYDADGNVTESYVVGDFDGDGSIGFSDLAIFSSSYGYCEGDPEFDERANLVTGDDPECIDVSDQSAFMSLFGLSATSVMRAELLWDAENRLAAYIPLNSWSGAGVPARSRLGANTVTFKYDYRGRR
ncbi:MAG: hypothetical protein IT450_00095, partial [Phycisphaerales bacterium]|nr:hypothetical protein [Phycisphaerales bacterium]